MARQFLAASTRILELNIGATDMPHGNAYPYTFHSWAYPEAAISAIMFGTYDTNNTTAPGARTQQTSGNQLQATFRDRNPTTNAAAVSSNSVTQNAWNGYTTKFEGDASRTAYINGGGKVTNTTNAPNGPMDHNYIAIGCSKYSLGNLSPFTGRIAEGAMWNAALNDDEVNALGHRVNPGRVRPSHLLVHYPLIGKNSSDGEHNVAKGGSTFNLSAVNTPGIADHAPVSPLFF